MITLSCLTGCAAWKVFTHDVAPVACAMLGSMETAGCQLHTDQGIDESDPRAMAIHAAGAALDALGAGADKAAIDGAMRAFLSALDEIKPGAGAIDGGTK
jgi:hypothetical protein